MEDAELQRLLSQVKPGPCSTIEGLGPFRDLLEGNDSATVLRFLTNEMPSLTGERLGGIAYEIANHYREVGDVGGLRKLFATDDADIKQLGLNALWGKPGSNPEMGPAIVELAICATSDPSPAVRTAAASVLQNQSGWGVEVSTAVAPLQRLLADAHDDVRQQAAYAVGNFAKSKYDMSECIAPLRKNVKDDGVYVRKASAWALWQLSRRKHDIASAVPNLAWLLTDDQDYNEPRKMAAGALLHHAKKSPANAADVKQRLCRLPLNENRKEIGKLLSELAKLG